MWALLASLAWADCPSGPTNNATLQRQVESALFAFSELDDAGFEAYRSQAVSSVYCLGELVRPHVAAEFLRLEGIHAFTKNNEPFARNAFANALQLEPRHELPTTIAPPGGPLHLVYQKAATHRVPMWTLPEGSFRTFVNGVPSTVAPESLAILQIEDTTGALPFSGIVTRPSDVPAPLIARLKTVPSGPNPLVVNPPPPLPGSGKSPKKGLAILSGIAIAAAGGVFGSAVISRGRYDAAPTKARRSLTNNLVLASGGAGIVALSLTLTTIAVPSKKKKAARRVAR